MLLRVAVLCLIAAAIAGCGAGEGEPAAGPAAFGGGPRLEAEMRNADGDPIGTVVMDAGPTGYLLSVTLQGLAPGPHGIHIHEVGTCDPDFGASGGHINPDGRQHGLLNPDGPDDGDLPNIFASEDGTVRAELFTTRADAAVLLDQDGSAIVVHENGDDHTTQPIGGAGGRVACGVLTR